MKRIRLIIIACLVICLAMLITVKPAGESGDFVKSTHKTIETKIKLAKDKKEQERIEAERKAEEERLEAERIAEEERLEQERLEAERLEEEQKQLDNAAYTDSMTVYETGGHLTPSAGVYWYGDQKETYYNLPMDGVVQTAWNNGITGDYWVRDDGCKMLGEYIIIACNRDVHPYGSIVETSLGLGISLDTGGFAYNNPYQVDIAVNW